MLRFLLLSVPFRDLSTSSPSFGAFLDFCMVLCTSIFVFDTSGQNERLHSSVNSDIRSGVLFCHRGGRDRRDDRSSSWWRSVTRR